MKPFLSIIVPCRNEVRFLDRCLRSILDSDYPTPLTEVLVVDGGSTDGSREIGERWAARDARVHLLENPRATTPWALNRGIDCARGGVIARIDAHAAVSPDYFSECVRYLESSGADCVGGAMRTRPRDRGPFAEAIVDVLSHPFGVGNSHFRIGSRTPRWVDTVFGGCWRREVFERVGRFHTALARSQDIEFSLRLKAAGGRTLLIPGVRTDYYARTRMRSFCAHNFTNGEWAILPFAYSRTIPVSWRHLVPLAFVASLAWAIVLAPWTRWPLAAVSGTYAILNLTASLRIAWARRSSSKIPRLGLVFLSLHLSYGAGSMWGIMRASALLLSRERGRWRNRQAAPQERQCEKPCEEPFEDPCILP